MVFQKTVVYIALILALIILLFVGYMMYRAKNALAWPPMISECPDYWTVTDFEKCANVKGLGNCGDAMDFTGNDWNGKAGLKKKFEWAKKCGITWDGVTNNASLTSV
jgi:hypothetical protein